MNIAFDLWIREDYHQRKHSSTGQSPLTRFGEHLEMIRKTPIDLEDHFRKEVRRRVTKDRTVSIDNRLYEAPTRFIGEQLSCLFHEHSPDKVEIIHQGSSQGLLVPLDKQVNAEVKRDRPGRKQRVKRKQRVRSPFDPSFLTQRQIKSTSQHRQTPSPRRLGFSRCDPIRLVITHQDIMITAFGDYNGD